jgi:hypothetical protein
MNGSDSCVGERNKTEGTYMEREKGFSETHLKIGMVSSYVLHCAHNSYLQGGQKIFVSSRSIAREVMLPAACIAPQ